MCVHACIRTHEGHPRRIIINSTRWSFQSREKNFFTFFFFSPCFSIGYGLLIEYRENNSKYIYFLKIFIYLFVKDREREREAETQAEGEAGSMQGARCGTRSQDSKIMPWAEGRCLTAEPPRHPPFFFCLPLFFSRFS